ncbi:hypothetical protein HKX48_002102 [Thoreauomyces humboldtii]|nr:hypothetical protein HKX48_002102 [Thoreauomyces humboldtii]
MEDTTNTGFFVVDVLSLKQPAGKPFHVEARMARHPRSVSESSQASDRHTAFIEDRVRRLKRRSSHVRAVGAATRKRESGDSSAKRARMTETLLTAERNRNSILERQVRICAEAVAHAKQVAKSQADRFASVTAARKAALDERLTITSLRRLRLLTTPRSRLAESRSSDQLHTTDSVVCIQQWWRKSKMGPALKIFAALNVTLDKAYETPFMQLVKNMQAPPLIKVVSRILLRLERMAPGPRVSRKNPARVFLSAYMLAAHPSELMPSMGPEEEALSGTAQTMLRMFEAWSSGFMAGAGHRSTERFWDVWTAYYDAFQSWKDNDSRKITDGMIAHFLELERLWLSVKDQPLADVEWAPRVTEHQTQLCDKLVKFGDKCVQRLAEERERVRESLELEAMPFTGSGIQLSPARYPSATEAPSRGSDSVSSRGSPEPTLAEPAAPVPAPKAIAKPVEAVVPEVVSSSMERADPQLAAIGYGAQLSNAQLAHELVMDPDFKLNPAKRSELEEQVRAMAKKAFFDAVRQEFAQGKMQEHVPAFMEQIRESLLAMVAEKGKFADNIKDVLDMDHIRQQVANGTFDVAKSLGYVTGKMLELCAPIRDATIRSVSQSIDLADAFQRVLGVLDDMKLDLANYRLQALRPVLQQQAVEYERAKFEEALAANMVSLTNTRAWLSSAAGSVASVAAARNPENIQGATRVGYESAYNEALLGLVFAPTPIDPSTVAETLLLDAERLHGFQNEAQAITIVAALVMLAKNSSRDLRDNASAIKTLRDTLFILLKDPATTVDNLALQIVSALNASKPSSSTLPSDQEAVVRSMVEKTLAHKDPVFALLARRTQATLRHTMDKGVFKRESLASAGLDVVQTELEGLAIRVARLAKHNKEVYAAHYDAILASALP